MKTKECVYTPVSLRARLSTDFDGLDGDLILIDEHEIPGWAHPFLVAFLPHPFDRQVLDRAFGRAYYETNVTLVRDELPKGAKSITVQHELGHLTGFFQVPFKVPYLTPFINEFGAHLYSIIKDPIGFIAAVAVTLNSPERRAFYRDRVRTGDQIGG